MFRVLVSHHPVWTFNVPSVAGARAVFRAAACSARQLTCGLRGHQMLMCYQPSRLALRCSFCGLESPGWEVGRRSGDDWSRLIPAARVNSAPVRRLHANGARPGPGRGERPASRAGV